MNNMTNTVEQVDNAFIYIIGFSFIFLFVITLVMIYFVIKYRRSKNPEPSDIRGNIFLEIAWIVIPTIIALSMFAIGWKSYTGLRNVPDGAMEVKVIAQKYSWIFIYENEKESLNELVVPKGKPIKLNITSEDVIHGLFIPAFRVKVDAVNGMNTYAWFYPDKIGTYMLQCTEFCGVGHADMSGTVKIVTSKEFETWLAEDDDDDDDEDDDDE